MIRNCNGFVLPFTLMVTTIVIFFFLNQLNMYVLEKKYYHEVEGTMTADTMMELAVWYMKKDIQKGIVHDGTVTLEFREGKAVVKTTMEEISEQIKNQLDVEGNETNMVEQRKLFHMMITCTTNNNMKYQVTFTYDPTLDAISNWVE